MIDTITDTVTSLTAEPETALANGSTSVVFTATVKNSNDQPVADSHVNFTNTGGTLSQTETTTNANGQATVSLTSSNTGYITVTAKLSNNPTGDGKSATVAFTANAATAKVNTLTADPNIAPANDRTPIIFTAIVKDSYGHLVSDLSVSFTTTGGTLSQKMATTNASGQASVRLTSASMGDITVTAKVSDNAVDKGKSATVSFTADIATSTVTNIQPPKGSSTTANFRLIPITATVEDRGHLVPNVDVRFTTTLGNISPKIATTKANGQTTVNLSGGTPGNAIVTAKVDSNANDTGKSTTVTFIPDIDRPIPKPE
ncbi:hypothetical protein Pcaca05_12070 [Pectobacterium carotovorum subsp. carotovorum]|nr:hypothetical protein Pcaca05_12070 [Pectobacterium carotovorum subsp. carotovorum]